MSVIDENPDVRNALVTGATGAIGAAIARGIASRPGYRVLLLCRDEKRARRTVEEIQRSTGNAAVDYRLVDVSRRSSILSLASSWEGPVHLLVNAAAITPRRREQTPEGIELQFATNVLGYFWMIQAFTVQLQAAPRARVVNLASYWAGGLDLADLEFRVRRYDNDLAYRQSKQADRMLSRAFAERLAPREISVNACHPGDVNSRLSQNLGFGGHESPDQGARTPVWLGTAPELEGRSGGYFEHLRETRCRFSEDRKAVESLFLACQAYGAGQAS
jgi:NAD(P)-dependent dehydrogenase (short-subunit alcohol dehydrogenase family)